MIPTNANFDNARNAKFQQPVFVFALPNLNLTYTMRAGQSGLTPTNTWMKVPTGLTQKIEDMQGKATIGSLSIEIVDKNRTLLGLFATTTWYGQPANLLLGFNGLTYPGDYITLFSGLVETVTPTSDHTGWVFAIRDKNRILKNKIYTTGNDGVAPTSKKNPLTLDGNPLALVLDCLENQLNIPAANIDTTSITNLQNGRFAATRMLFSLTKAVEGLSFLEQELLRPNGLFHFVRYNGNISIGDMLAAPAPVPIAFAFNDSNIVGVPAFKQQTIYNWVEFALDYDGSKYLDTEEFVDSNSVNKFGLTQVLSISSQGLRTNFQGASRAGITARRIFKRYADQPASLLTLVHPSLQAVVVEVGDYVTVTHRLLEDLDTGTLGWSNRICQVLQVQPKWDAGQISFDLLDVNALASRPGPQLAPDTIPVYTSATTGEQQQYIFMANAAGQQSTGAAAAEVF